MTLISVFVCFSNTSRKKEKKKKYRVNEENKKLRAVLVYQCMCFCCTCVLYSFPYFIRAEHNMTHLDYKNKVE